MSLFTRSANHPLTELYISRFRPMNGEPRLTEPHDCSESGHAMRLIKSSEDYDQYKCLYCGQEELK